MGLANTVAALQIGGRCAAVQDLAGACVGHDGQNIHPRCYDVGSSLTLHVIPGARALSQFFRVGKLKAFDPNEVYQPDTRLRLGVGVKAAGVGGKTVSAGGARRPAQPPAEAARPVGRLHRWDATGCLDFAWMISYRRAEGYAGRPQGGNRKHAFLSGANLPGTLPPRAPAAALIPRLCPILACRRRCAAVAERQEEAAGAPQPGGGAQPAAAAQLHTGGS